MFEKGQYIIYETAGVCRVTDITTVDMNGMSKDKLYYILEPQHMKNSKIITPVEHNKSFMRNLLTEEEAHMLVDQIKDIGQLWIPDEKQREERYKAALKSCDCREWIGIIKTLYQRRQERLAHNKKLPEMDERYDAKAREYLHTELAISLNITEEQVEEYIASRIKSLTAAS